MAIGKSSAVRGHLRTLFHVGTMRELTDGQLLERFATARGETAEPAFAALVERHGPMVLRVCRSVLQDPHDAQDAFQATFLVLVKKARALWVRDSLGPWLHQVSYRTATCARTASARRRRHERCAAMSKTEGRVEVGEELMRVLHEEIDRLPERYRAAIVLCDLGGRTHDQAARHLGCPVGTVKSRLSRGRDRLRERIRHRGIAPDGSLFCFEAVRAVLSPALVHSTARAAVQSISAGTIVERTAAATLAREVVRAMSLTHWLKVGSVVLALGAAAPGVGLLAQKESSGVETRLETSLESPRAAAAPVLVAKPGKLSVTFVARGVVEASRSPFVTCPVEGRTTILAILPEGTKVRKGDLVCELDSAALRDNLTNQEITTKGAEAAYQNAKLTREVAEIAVVEYEQGIYKQDRETVLGEINLAQADLKRAEDRLAWTLQMEKKGFVSEGQVTTERLSLQKAKFALEQAQTKKNVLEKYTHGKTVKELESEVEKARSDELAKERTWQLEKTKEGKLRKQIESCRLYAPGDGPIVYANSIRGRFDWLVTGVAPVDGPTVDANGPVRTGRPQIARGATVRERQIIFFVPDLSSPMQVDVKVPETIVRRIAPGLGARITVDAFEKEILPGAVDTVAPLPDQMSSLNKNDSNVYTTKVKIERSLPGLLPGMTAVVEILVTQLENVLSVPVSAVLDYDGKDHLVVKKPDGQTEWREVTLRIRRQSGRGQEGDRERRKRGDRRDDPEERKGEAREARRAGRARQPAGQSPLSA